MQTPLTAEQITAIELNGRLCCVVAGPGSGKTHMLVARIEADQRTSGLENSVVVTFTNAAAAELRERLGRRGIDATKLRHLGTLHSWATRELHRIGKVGEIATEKTLEEVIDACKKTLGSMARNMSRKQAWEHAVNPPEHGSARTVGMAIRNRLRKANLTHHDLILSDFLEAITSHKIVAPKAIYVDEYQDSSPIDAAIYNTFSLCDQSRLFVIGDPRQAIYGFRGATEQNLRDAWENADSKAILTTNHRSNYLICELATRIGRRMPKMDFDPLVQSAMLGGVGMISRVPFQTEGEEIQAIALAAETTAAAALFSGEAELAILCRYNAQARAVAAELRGRGLDCTCSADKPVEEGQATLAGAIEALQAWWQIPDESVSNPREWWYATMTALGIGFEFQRQLITELVRCRTPEDLINLGTTDQAGEIGRIHIATVHAAKGLEWRSVWVMGADHLTYSGDNAEHGRFFFVACTRAKQSLTISHAASRVQPESGKLISGLLRTEWAV